MNKRFVTLMLVMLCALWVGGAIQGQGSADYSIYYLLDIDGISQLVRADLTGAQISISSVEQGSVVAYDASDSVAFVTRSLDGQLTLHLSTLDGSQTLEVLSPATQVYDVRLTPDAVYVNAKGADELPVMFGYDRSLNLIMTRPVALRDAVQTISPSGEWALAYHSSGQFGVYALPSTVRAEFPMIPNGFTAMAWSPTVDQFQLIGANTDGTQPFIYLIDLDLNTTRQFSLPTIPANSIVQAKWSDHGRYIVYSTSATSDRLLITDVTTGIQTELAEPGFILAPLTWSADDEWLLYIAQIGGASSDLFAFNPLTGERRSIRIPGAQIASAVWSPDAGILAATTIGLNNTITIYTAVAPAFDLWIPIFTTDDGRFAQAFVYWAGTSLLFEHDSSLLLATAPTQQLTRISPTLYPIVLNSIFVSTQ